jgi:hypothetical protein
MVNQIGDLGVHEMRSAQPAYSNSFDQFPGQPHQWGLSFDINMQPGPNGRAAGSISWAGLLNCCFWLDPVTKVTGAFFTQILPFYDDRVVALYGAFEHGLYRRLGRGRPPHLSRMTRRYEMKTSIDSTRQRRVRAASAVVGLALAASTGAAIAEDAPQGQMAADLGARAMDIPWPAGFEPERADLFAHNENRVGVSCETVWQHIVDARVWPDWYPNAQGVGLLDGAHSLAPDVRWRWTTFGLAIESRGQEFVPDRRLGWFGGAPGEAPSFYHSWLLTPEGDGCRGRHGRGGRRTGSGCVPQG